MELEKERIVQMESTFKKTSKDLARLFISIIRIILAIIIIFLIVVVCYYYKNTEIIERIHDILIALAIICSLGAAEVLTLWKKSEDKIWKILLDSNY